MTTRAPSDAGFSRRRFLAGGLGGMAFVALGGGRAFGMGGLGAHRDRAPHAREGIRVDFHSRVFNGQDIDLARFLSVSVARSFPEYAALMTAGGNVAQALAWALAPSGAEETRRLHALAKRPGFQLAAGDELEIVRDREERDRAFREALRIMLPGTEFFRMYVDRLTRDGSTLLGRSATARLTAMKGAGVLSPGDVELLLDRDGPESAVLDVRPLHAFQRYASYRYLSVDELLRTQVGADDGLDLLVPTSANFDPPLSDSLTSRRDQVLALGELVALCGGRVHPLVPFDPYSGRDRGDLLALVQDAVLHRGFVGVTLSSALGRRPIAAVDEVLRALLAWCEVEEVVVVDPWARVDEADAAGMWSSLLESYPELRLGLRALACDFNDAGARSSSRLMYGVDWLRRSIEGSPADLVRQGDVTHWRVAAHAVPGNDAAAFMGLRTGERTRQRLERFYDRHRMAAPRWMSTVDR